MSDETKPNLAPMVAESIAGNRLRVSPHRPLWIGDLRQFDNWYDLVRKVEIAQHGQPLAAVYVGEKSPRVCAFCSKHETQETFHKDADTVPANLGNRHDFTREECDTCNHAHVPLLGWLALDR